MKRIITFKRISTMFLAVLMLFSLMPMTTFAASTTVVTVDKEISQKSQELLSGIDMLADPQAEHDAIMSRSDFAKLLADMMRYTGFATKTADYRDVSDGTKNVNEIYFAIEQGYLVGEKGLFRPEDGITAIEAARALVEMTGNNIRKTIITDSGYMMKASSLGILKSVDVEVGSAFLSVGAAYKMAANTLSATSIKPDAFSGTGASLATVGNFLEVMHNIRRVAGRLTKTKYVSLDSTGGAGKNAIEIDHIRFLAKEDWTQYLGYTVYAYVDFRDVDAEVLHLIPTSNNGIVELKSENIISLDKNRKIVYSFDENEEDETMFLTTGTVVIWNGTNGGTIRNFTNNELALRSETGDSKPGFVKLIDSDGDNVCDVIVIMSYEVFYLKAADQIKEYLIDKTEKILDMSQYSENDRFIRYESGGEASFDSFDKELVVLIAESRDKKMITAVITENTIEATVTEVRMVGNQEEYLIDGKWYRGNDYFCKYYTDRPGVGQYVPDNLSVGWHGYLLLDTDGRISVLQPQSAAHVAYLIDISKSAGLSTETKARVFTDMDTAGNVHEVQILDFASKVSVNDGSGYVSYSEDKVRNIPNLLKTPEGPGLTDFNHQLVRFTVNNNKEINTLLLADTSRTWTGTDFLNGNIRDEQWFNDYSEFALSYDASAGGTITEFTDTNSVSVDGAEVDYSNAVKFGPYVFDQTTFPLWVIPPEDKLHEDSLFDYAQFDDYYATRDLKIYDMKKDMTISNIVWQQETMVEREGRWSKWRTLLVTDVRKVLDAEGAITTKIAGYHNTHYSNEKMTIQEFTSDKSNLLNDVKVGDVIQMEVNTSNQITHMQRLFSYKDGQRGFVTEGSQQLQTSPDNYRYAQNCVPYWGKVLYNSLTGLSLTFKNDSNIYGEDYVRFAKTTYFEWIVHDTKTGETWLDKTPMIYGVLDVGDVNDATDCLILHYSNDHLAMGVIYLK